MTVIKDAVNTSARYAKQDDGDYNLNIQSSVIDDKVKQADSDFDGLEDVFARIPKLEGDRIVWQEHKLEYQHSYWAGHGVGVNIDIHQGIIAGLNLSDINIIAGMGIAVGLHTNVGDIWAQEPDMNVKPTQG